MEYQKQLVIFEEVSEISLPMREIEIYVADFSFTGREKILRVPLRMLKGHSFLDIPYHLPSGEKYGGEKYDTDWVPDFEKITGLQYKIRYILYESGGGYTNTGAAQIICGLDGSPLKPLYVRRKGHLACGTHAAFAVWDGQEAAVVKASHHRGEFQIQVLALRATRDDLEEEIIWEGENIFSLEDVLPERFNKFKTAIRSAMKKATCYHCRSPHYILTGLEK